MAKYRRQSDGAIVDAFQMTRERRWDNRDWPEWLNKAWNEEAGALGSVYPDPDAPVMIDQKSQEELAVGTPEGKRQILWGGYIVQVATGSLYFIDGHVVENNYELIDDTKTDMVTVSAAKVELVKREAQVAHDMHDALGVEWGHDPYAVIQKLKAAAEALKTTRDMAAASMDPETFERFDKVMEPALKGVKDATYSAKVARLESELHVAAGMLSTTGDWASKHPQDALDFIRKSAAEIVAKDKSYVDEMQQAKANTGAVMIWGGDNLNMLREFVAPHKVSQADLIAHIEGVEGAEMLPPGSRIINDNGVISVGGPTRQDDTLMCCHIECTEPADYEIVSGPAPDDYTHACVKHVGDLLGDAHEHRIHSIKDAMAVKPAERQSVEVLMAERTETAFDGPAFSSVPPWLETALKVGTVRESRVGALDYMTWLVVTVEGSAIAAPGHCIVRAEDGALAVHAGDV